MGRWLCGVVESHEGPPKGVQCSGALCDMPALGCAAGSSPERKRSKKDKKEKHKKKVRGAFAVQLLAPMDLKGFVEVEGLLRGRTDVAWVCATLLVAKHNLAGCVAVLCGTVSVPALN